MDNQMLLATFSTMLEKMSDEEISKTLFQAKSLLSPQDYEKLKEIVERKKNRSGS